MEERLIEEISEYTAYRRRLRRLLKETLTCSSEIDAIVSSKGVQISEDEEKQLRGWLVATPSVCILSTKSWVRACLVNSILNKRVLPLCRREDTHAWHTLKLSYGDAHTSSLVLTESGSSEDYVVTKPLECDAQGCTTVTYDDLLRVESGPTGMRDNAVCNSLLNVKVRDSVLSCDSTTIVAPDFTEYTEGRISAEALVDKYCRGTCCTILYGIEDGQLSELDIQFLRDLKMQSEEVDTFFVCMSRPPVVEYHNSDIHGSQPLPDLIQVSEYQQCSQTRLTLLQKLDELGYNSINRSMAPGQRVFTLEDVVTSPEDMGNFPAFLSQHLNSLLMKTAVLLHVIHTRILEFVVAVSFDMKRDIMVTPTKIKFVRREEASLFNDLLQKTKQKEADIRQGVKEIHADMTALIPDLVDGYKFVDVEVAEDGRIKSKSDLSKCTEQLHGLVIHALNDKLVDCLTQVMSGLKELYTGVLVRCLEKLEEGGDEPQATAALQEMLRVAYTVEVHAPSKESVLQLLLSKLQQFLRALHIGRVTKVDAEWKRATAQVLVNGFSQDGLAHSLCNQLRSRLEAAHHRFTTGLKRLDLQHKARLQGMEKKWLDIRKSHAPRLARLLLFSTSVKHVLAWGMPQYSRELGRGQYGIVYGLERWGCHEGCAVKSLAPPDIRHLQDMAMEFYYTQRLPPHPNIVPLLGSAIDYNYGEGKGGCPAVLLVMPRYRKDLHIALGQGLPIAARLQVGIDVVLALRFLHQQGLIHRDVKLKNVLLTSSNRGKLTDLGFCKANAMMSGSVVGTPIHMAPELFDGTYDNSVDTYAFGILLWYIIAGQNRLPQKFAECNSKEELWANVRSGRRPERLPRFDEASWKLMSECWSAEPAKRPHLGEVQFALEQMKSRYQEKSQVSAPASPVSTAGLRAISSESEF